MGWCKVKEFVSWMPYCWKISKQTEYWWMNLINSLNVQHSTFKTKHVTIRCFKICADVWAWRLTLNVALKLSATNHRGWGVNRDADKGIHSRQPFLFVYIGTKDIVNRLQLYDNRNADKALWKSSRDSWENYDCSNQILLQHKGAEYVAFIIHNDIGKCWNNLFPGRRRPIWSVSDN